MSTPYRASMSVPGLSRARLQKIDRFLLERYIGPGKLPCALTVVARHGVVAHMGVLAS